VDDQARLAHSLVDATDDLAPVLGMLDAALGGRALLVSDWDALGTAGVDRELGLALLPRMESLRSWLAERAQVLTFQRRAPDGRPPLPVPREPPVQLVNGAIQDTRPLLAHLGADGASYALGLAVLALGCAQDEVLALTETGLRARLWELLPPSTRTLLLRLGLHDRPLRRDHLPPDITPEAVALGADLGLWSTDGADLQVEAGWAEALRQSLPGELVRQAHLELAESFLRDFRLGDDSAWAAGVSVLEAHRHLVEAGELERARHCWHFGVPLVVEAARRRSLDHRFADAAKLYEAVVGAIDRREVVAPSRLCGYARHYLHYNRAHGRLEDRQATERGYRAALRDWPENALFWSRLVRVEFYLDRPAQALADLAQAQQVVEEHPQKQTFLVARTVRGLLDHGRFVEAVQTWATYLPDTFYAREIEGDLARALAKGWAVERLLLDSDAPLIFTRPLQLQLLRAGGRWSAEVPELACFAEGGTPLDALRGLVTRVREDCATLVRSYTHTLPLQERMRKRLLLGAVDIVASRVDAAAPREWWMMGHLERDDCGRLWLKAGGARAERYEVPAELVEVVDDLPHLARVDADASGAPRGPVRLLLPGFRGSEEDLWRAWRARVADAG
jgi:tetratricopeptide (TPR) repeat protein